MVNGGPARPDPPSPAPSGKPSSYNLASSLLSLQSNPVDYWEADYWGASVMSSPTPPSTPNYPSGPGSSSWALLHILFYCKGTER